MESLRALPTVPASTFVVQRKYAAPKMTPVTAIHRTAIGLEGSKRMRIHDEAIGAGKPIDASPMNRKSLRQWVCLAMPRMRPVGVLLRE